MRDDGDRLPTPLSDAASLLRELPAVRAEWRAGVLREVASAKKPARRLSLSVSWAIAAGLVCALAGGGVTLLATHARVTPASVASADGPSTPAATLPVRFSIVAPNAAQVAIVGDFNHWNPTTLPMRRSADGRTWEVEVRLPLGRYSYAFLIDGSLRLDPDAPRGSGDDFGAPNSVLMVRGS